MFIATILFLAFVNASPLAISEFDAVEHLKSLSGGDFEAHLSSSTMLASLYDTLSKAYPHLNVPIADESRLSILQTNIQNIVDFNKINGASKAGLNQFTPFTTEENTKRILMKPQSNSKLETSGPTSSNKAKRTSFPNNFDWRSMDNVSYVTSVKDQICGTCWAFAAVGALESAILISHKKLINVELSIPHAIYGATLTGATLCDGGTAQEIYNYAQSAKISMDNHYPLNATNFPTDGEKLVNGVWPGLIFPNLKALSGLVFGDSYRAKSSYVTVQNTREAFIAAVNLQPLTFFISAGDSMFLYRSGILTVENCGLKKEINHLLLLVGYNKIEKYWIAKNSWSSNWGENGFIRLNMADDAIGYCSMYTLKATAPSLSMVLS